MIQLSLLGLLWAGGALAQSNHATGAFHYVGCMDITASPARSIPLDPQNCTPEACQQACTGYAYAAVYPTTCECYNNIGTQSQLPEDKCDNWCDGNSNLGRCGSCSNGALSNVYSCETGSAPAPAPIPQPKTTIVVPPYSAPAPVPTPAAQPHTSTSCVTIVGTQSPLSPVSYGQPSGTTVVVQGTSKWTSTTRSTWSSTSTTRSTWTSTKTGTSTHTSYSTKPGYSVPPASGVPPGYGNPPATVQGTPPVYGSGVVPATPNPGYTSTKGGSHPHSTTPGTPGATNSVAGAGSVSGSLFAVVLALGAAVG